MTVFANVNVEPAKPHMHAKADKPRAVCSHIPGGYGWLRGRWAGSVVFPTNVARSPFVRVVVFGYRVAAEGGCLSKGDAILNRFPRQYSTPGDALVTKKFKHVFHHTPTLCIAPPGSQQNPRLLLTE